MPWSPTDLASPAGWFKYTTGVFTNLSNILAAKFTSANSEWLSRANEATLQPGVTWSMSFWFYAASGVQVIISKDASSAGNVQILIYHDGNNLNLVVTSSAGSQSTAMVAAAAGVWHHAVCCWRDAERKATIYLNNGAAVQGVALVAGMNTTGNAALEFGRRAADGFYFNGRLSRVLYHDRDYTADERTSFYNSGNGKLYANLTAAEKVSLKEAWDLTESGGNRAGQHGGKTLTDNNTVTSDVGPGDGPASDGDQVKRWEDQLASANHLTADTVSLGNNTKQAKYLAGRGIGCFDISAPTNASSLQRTSLASSIARDDFSAGIILSPNGANNILFSLNTGTADFGIKTGYELGGDALTPYLRVWNGSAWVTTTIRHRSRKMWVSVRSTSTALELWSNGGQHWTGSALSSKAMTRLELAFMPFQADCNGPGILREFILSDDALSDTDQTSLNTYLETEAPTQSSGKLFVMGDSITWGSSCEDGEVWHQLIDGWDMLERRSYSSGGFTMASHMISAAAVAAMVGDGAEIALIYLGTNDLLNGQTAAQLETNVSNYSSTLRNAGFKTIVFTIQAINGVGASRTTFNTNLRANWSGYADGLADIAARAELSDQTNTTYFASDGLHLKKAAHVVIADVVETSLASLSFPPVVPGVEFRLSRDRLHYKVEE